MTIEKSLYEGEHICLASIDHEKDPPIESVWTHDPEYIRMLGPEPVRPLSAEQIKKKYEAIEKEIEESKNLFYFTLRMRQDDRLIGFARLFWVEWNNASAFLELGIGDPKDRGHGFGREALDLLLNYAFDELNLHRLSARIPEYNTPAIHLFERTGFQVEVRRREALLRDGKRWDMLHLGILREEWSP
jgi:RimJ/RimL family protein N-acetyltransferase